MITRPGSARLPHSGPEPMSSFTLPLFQSKLRLNNIFLSYNFGQSDLSVSIDMNKDGALFHHKYAMTSILISREQ